MSVYAIFAHNLEMLMMVLRGMYTIVIKYAAAAADDDDYVIERDEFHTMANLHTRHQRLVILSSHSFLGRPS